VLAAAEAQTLAISNKAKQMKKQGMDIISLSVGEPDFNTPQCAMQAAMQAMEHNYTHYTESNGIPELRRAVAQKFHTVNGIQDATPDTVLISGGAKQSIYNALMAICNEGDEVIIPAPYWVSYPAMVIMAGAKPVILHTDYQSSYKITPEQLEKALTPNTKCIILNSPSNPTGMMYSKQEMEDLAAIIAKHSCYVLSDEIYEMLSYGQIAHFSPGSLDILRGRVITVNGVSKAYAMTGWRIGFLHAPAPVLAEAAKVQGQSTSHPSSIAQYAALGALQHGEPDAQAMRKQFAARRDMICGLLSAIPGIRFHVPDGAFYVFIELNSMLSDVMPDDVAFCDYLLNRHMLALVPGDAFGMQGAIRISFAASEETLRRGVERLANAITECKCF
jgi:aspartate aminotransferase